MNGRGIEEHLTQATERGVSTVVGVTILVGIVVLLASLVGSVVFGIADTGQDTAFAGVTVSQTADTTVEVRVDSMGEAEALLVETAGGKQVVTSPGIYEYDSFGREVRVIGSDGETTQLLQTFEPDAEPTQTADILTVESDQTVQSATGNQTFETLDAAKQAAETGDVIRFDSGVHVQPGTVNETVTTPVTIVAEPNTVFSCDQTQVNLRLQSATMSQRSAFIQTNQCGFQPVTVPAPEGSGGNVDVLAGGTDTSNSNLRTQAETQGEAETTVFDSESNSNTLSSDSRPATTPDTSVTVRVSSTSNYQSLTVSTQAGERTFTEPGVYEIDTYGYNAIVSGTTDSGETVQLDTIVAEEQQSEVTSNKTQSGEIVNKTSSEPITTYLVEADNSNAVVSESDGSVKRVSTLSEADSQASEGNLIKLESGVHSDPKTVTASLETNATLSIGPNVRLSCEQTKIDLSLGKSTLSDQSPFPDVFCDEFNGVSEESVTETLNSSSVTIPENVSFDESLSYNNNTIVNGKIAGVTTDSDGNVYVTGDAYIGEDSDYYTIKYDSQGNTIWTQRYDGGDTDHANDIAVDSNGNVYVTGESTNTYRDYYTIKYDSNGDMVWSQRYDNGEHDQANAVAVDSNGNVYVTGRSIYSDFNYYTIKYNSQGQKQWDRRYENGDVFGSYDAAKDIAVDGDGNVYVTGTSRNDNDEDDYYTIKYDSQGNEVWNQRDGIGDDDGGEGIAVDSNGNVYVTGRVSDRYDNGDYYTIKYNNQGTKQWSERYNNGNFDRAYGIAIDSNDNVYVTGESEGLDEVGDFYTLKYNATGGTQWEKRYDSGTRETAYDVAVTENGVVYVGGESQNGYHLRKYTGSESSE